MLNCDGQKQRCHSSSIWQHTITNYHGDDNVTMVSSQKQSFNNETSMRYIPKRLIVSGESCRNLLGDIDREDLDC